MGRYLDPGNEAFTISRFSEIYVDKSGLLSFTNKRIGQEKRFICVSRPRRFGKSMAANMLCAYYSCGCDSRELFKELDIAGDTSFLKHINQYHVLYFEMQRFLTRAGDAAELVKYIEKEVVKELYDAYPDILERGERHLAPALEKIYEVTKEKFIFIIDEWDSVYRENETDVNAQKIYLDFLRDLLKGQVYVSLAYMTGILPIKKYGRHSALNIFDEFSMLSPKQLARYTGFTEDEVKALCKSYGMSFDEAKTWYDGYRSKGEAYIPNMEVSEEFAAVIEGSGGWGILSDMLRNSERLLEATLNKDSEKVADYLEQIHMDAASIIKYNDENSLSCVISLAYYTAVKDYEIFRELPSGKGFADFVFLPRKESAKPAIVFELKWDFAAEGAIRQIKERKYVNAIQAYTGKILLVGVNYDKASKKHHCVIETCFSYS